MDLQKIHSMITHGSLLSITFFARYLPYIPCPAYWNTQKFQKANFVSVAFRQQFCACVYLHTYSTTSLISQCSQLPELSINSDFTIRLRSDTIKSQNLLHLSTFVFLKFPKIHHVIILIMWIATMAEDSSANPWANFLVLTVSDLLWKSAMSC